MPQRPRQRQRQRRLTPHGLSSSSSPWSKISLSTGSTSHSIMIIRWILVVCVIQGMIFVGFLVVAPSPSQQPQPPQPQPSQHSQDHYHQSPTPHLRNLRTIADTMPIVTTKSLHDNPQLVHNYTHSIWNAWKDLSRGQGRTLPYALPRQRQRQQQGPSLSQTKHDAAVTMVVHTGVSKFPRLLFSMRRWQGPVSAAIYVTTTKEVQDALDIMSHIRQVFPQTEVHLYMENEPWDAYPHNILRQLALQWASATDYVLTLDVDFVTPPQASETLTNLLLQNPDLVHRLRHEKHALVLPAFEGHVQVSDEELESSSTLEHALPSSKQEVPSYVQDHRISPFHVDFFPSGHKPTNFEKWFHTTDSPAPDLYLIDYACKFEPYVLTYKGPPSTSGSSHHSHDTHSNLLPSYWTGFRGFGFNKWTWLTELYFSGYQFGVLTCDKCFVVHLSHPKGENLVPNYKEYSEWKHYFRKTYGDWSRDEAEWILSDRKELKAPTSSDQAIQTHVLSALQTRVQEEYIPILVGWKPWKSRLLGRVLHSTLHEDMEFVGTSEIVDQDGPEILQDSIVVTKAGQQYYLSAQELQWYDD